MYKRPIQIEQLALVRYRADGTLDTGFGTGGKLRTDVGGSDTGSDQAFSVAIQPNGKIVAGGFSEAREGDDDFAVVRYDGAGNLDSRFGTDGRVLIDFGSVSDKAFGIVLQPDGKIVAAGGADWGGSQIRTRAPTVRRHSRPDFCRGAQAGRGTSGRARPLSPLGS